MLIGPCARNKILRAAPLEVRQVLAVRCFARRYPYTSAHRMQTRCGSLHIFGSQCARTQFRCFRCGKGEGDEAKLRRIRIETEQEQARRRDPRAF